jgi:hypothetical protein
MSARHNGSTLGVLLRALAGCTPSDSPTDLLAAPIPDRTLCCARIHAMTAIKFTGSHRLDPLRKKFSHCIVMRIILMYNSGVAIRLVKKNGHRAHESQAIDHPV